MPGIGGKGGGGDSIEKRARYVSCRRAAIWPRGSTFKVVEFPATIQCHGRFTNEQLNFAVLRTTRAAVNRVQTLTRLDVERLTLGREIFVLYKDEDIFILRSLESGFIFLILERSREIYKKSQFFKI